MSWQTVTDSYLGRCALCVATLAVSLVLFPLLALALSSLLPRMIGNALFFWPQYLLLLSGVREQLPAAAVHAADVAAFAMALFWLAAVALLVRLTSRWRVRSVLLALFPGVVLVAMLVLMALRSVGYAPVLDGP